jgi:hypothetical protein
MVSDNEDALELARETITALREDNKAHEDFINECLELIPPSYDADEGQESIVLRFLKDMAEVGRILAKLTSDYR